MWYCSWSHSLAPQLLSQQRHGDKIFNCSNFSSWQAFKCERMNTNTLKYTSAGPGSSCRGRGRRGWKLGLPSQPQVECSNIVLVHSPTQETSQTTCGLCPKKWFFFASWHILGSGQGSWNISLRLPQPRWPHLELEIINSLFKSNLHGLGPPR